MQGSRSETLTSAGLLVLRVGVGLLLATHGWDKIQMLTSGDPATFPDPLGIGPKVSLGLSAAAEFLCALMVAAGLFTRCAAMPVVFSMGVAAFIVHSKDPWLMSQAAKAFQTGAAKSMASREPALLYMIPFLALILTGGGCYSLDSVILKKRKSPPPT